MLARTAIAALVHWSSVRAHRPESISLSTEVLTRLGRHPESEIRLDDITVSRRHAEVTRIGDSYTVRDVGSLNGTYVNQHRVDDATLAHGDEVQIGKFRLVFFDGVG